MANTLSMKKSQIYDAAMAAARAAYPEIEIPAFTGSLFFILQKTLCKSLEKMILRKDTGYWITTKNWKIIRFSSFLSL